MHKWHVGVQSWFRTVNIGGGNPGRQVNNTRDGTPLLGLVGRFYGDVPLLWDFRSEWVSIPKTQSVWPPLSAKKSMSLSHSVLEIDPPNVCIFFLRIPRVYERHTNYHMVWFSQSECSNGWNKFWLHAVVDYNFYTGLIQIMLIWVEFNR